MAKKPPPTRSRRPSDYVPDDELNVRNITPTDEDLAVQDFVSKFPEARRVSILKISETGRYAHLSNVSPDVVSEDYIQRKFGGGTFEIRFHDSNGRVLKRHCGIEIGAPPQDETKPAAVAIVPAAPPASAPIDVITMLREESNRQHQLMLEMIRANQGGGGGNNLADIVAAFAQLKQLEPKPPPPAPSSIDLATTAFMKGLELNNKVQGKPAGESNEMLSFFRDVLDMAKPMIEKAVGGNNNAAAEEGGEVAEEMDIEPALNFLKAKCRQGRSVEMIAEMVIDQMQGNAEFTNIVMALVSAPAEEFLALDAEFAQEPFRSWMSKLHADLRTKLVPAPIPPTNGATSV